MAGFAGSALVVTWIQAAATTVLTGDHKSLTYTPTINLYDETAGADGNKKYIPGTKDGTMTFNANMQGGTGAGGTATYSTLTEGNIGTLEWEPEGTASTKPNYAAPVISQGVQSSEPYDNVVEVTVNFQQNGLRVESANS